jgi:hypothetical protein
MLRTKLWLGTTRAEIRFAAKAVGGRAADPRVARSGGHRGVGGGDGQDQEPAVRAEIVSALGDIEHRSVLKPLLAALRDHSDAVQELAVQALKKVGDASVIDPLVGVLLRGTPGVQYHAAQTLRGWAGVRGRWGADSVLRRLR